MMYDDCMLFAVNLTKYDCLDRFDDEGAWLAYNPDVC